VSAFDELRFGPQRTLNLRATLPTAAEAERRTEAWLREQQVRGSDEVLVITGRGNQSADGIGVLHAAIDKLLFSLRRRGVIASHHEHNPGAFAVRMASLRALADAPARRREHGPRTPPAAAIHGLSADTIDLLRQLAERSLEALGASPEEARINDEMQRHLRMIAPGLPAGDEMEDRLRAVLRAAIAEYD
jgi:hypothetical protein